MASSFDNLQVGDAVIFIEKSGYGWGVPFFGTVREVSEGADGRTFRCEFISRGCGCPRGWFYGYQLKKIEGTAEEANRAHNSEKLPRWA